MDRNIALEFVRATEDAAIAASGWIGKGDAHGADKVAVDAMRSRLNSIDFSGKVVIGEGAKDEAPELYAGEEVGNGKGVRFDLAVDPLECTDSVAYGRHNALSVIAAGSEGSLLHAPDTYMDKIAVGPYAKAVISLDCSVEENIKAVADSLEKDCKDITVVVLDRERHAGLFKEIRATGACINLIMDGDVVSAIETCFSRSGVDLILGRGGSAEGVIAAAAVKALGGELLARFAPRNEGDKDKLEACGITDLSKVFRAEELAAGKSVFFTATGVIGGPLLKGIVRTAERVRTHSLVIRAKSGTVRYLRAEHMRSDTPVYEPSSGRRVHD